MGCCMGKKAAAPREATWAMPYLSRLEGNVISAGQSVLVRGYINAKKRVDISLSTGPRVEGDNLDDVIMLVSVRMDKKAIFLSSLTDNKPSAEKKLANPFKVGHEFDFRIRAHDDRFEVFANRELLGEFALTKPLTALTHIYVTGTAELSNVSWEGKYYTMPYEALIPDHFTVGRRLNVSGEWVKDKKRPERLDINLYTNHNDVAFHFQPRFNEKCVVRNSYSDGKWQKEEKKGKMPFNKSKNFDIGIQCNDKHFECLVDGVPFCTFEHRHYPHEISKVTIDGDADLHAVHLM